MALRDQPYFPFYVNDWMCDERLRMCSPESCGVYIWIMCVLHKMDAYGSISIECCGEHDGECDSKSYSKTDNKRDNKRDNKLKTFAKVFERFLPYDSAVIEGALEELVREGCLKLDSNTLYQSRMVKDGEKSEKRTASGRSGMNSRWGKNSKTIAKPIAKAITNALQNTEDEDEDEDINNSLEIGGVGERTFPEAPADDEVVVVETIPALTADQRKAIIEAWNAAGFAPVKKLMPGTERYKMLDARAKEYGFDEIMTAIGNAAKSTFMHGCSRSGWTANFEWFVRPNNFPKVLEGQYNGDNPQVQQAKHRNVWDEIIESAERAEREGRL